MSFPNKSWVQPIRSQREISPTYETILRPSQADAFLECCGKNTATSRLSMGGGGGGRKLSFSTGKTRAGK